MAKITGKRPMAKITGKRPTPRVAVDHSPTYSPAVTPVSRVSSSKTPTGSRPKPRVAKNSLPSAGKTPVATRPAAKHTPMPAPKTKWARRGGGAPHGG